MTKEKRSFFEKLTGSKRTGEEEINSNPSPVTFYEDDSEDETMMEVEAEMPAQEPSAMAGSAWQEDENMEDDGQLTIDMYQTDNDVVVKSTIAGVKPEDIDVSINNDMLTIRGTRSTEETVEQENYYYQECYWGSFSRSVVLPVDVLPEKVEASLKNGILTVKLPKADTNKVKKIQVRGF